MIVKAVVQTVYEELKARITSTPVTGIQHVEMGILPEGRIPASWGQRFLSVHAESVNTVAVTASNLRTRRVRFVTTLVQRLRDTPNDRFGGKAYTDVYSMSEILEIVSEVVENVSTLYRFQQYLIDESLPYQATGTFELESGVVDPIHLYPSFFTHISSEDTETESDKIAGYRMPFYFVSPRVHKTISHWDESGECGRQIGYGDPPLVT